jgi:hypothetical protein
MNDLPTQDLRSNLLTLAVPPCLGPAVARVMLDNYPAEPFDPGFRGQALETTYFDTRDSRLRKARRKGRKYLTLRIRKYPRGAYALSAKTEDRKFRVEVSPNVAEDLLGANMSSLARSLPGDLLSRLLELTDDRALAPVVTVCATRYAVEDEQDRITLDLDIATDTGKSLATGVLEFKSTRADAPPPDSLAPLGLRPIKISKFLWATLWR